MEDDLEISLSFPPKVGESVGLGEGNVLPEVSQELLAMLELEPRIPNAHPKLFPQTTCTGSHTPHIHTGTCTLTPDCLTLWQASLLLSGGQVLKENLPSPP